MTWNKIKFWANKKNTHVWGNHHGFFGNLQFNTSKWKGKSSGANFSFDWWLCHSWNDAIPQFWKKTVRFEIPHKTEGLRWSFVSLFSLFVVVWFCSKVCLSSLVCRMGLHPTLPGPGLPSQFCTTMTRFIDIKQLAHHPVAAQGQEVGCLRWSHRLHLRPPPANQQPIYLQSQQSNQSLWASCFVQ